VAVVVSAMDGRLMEKSLKNLSHNQGHNYRSLADGPVTASSLFAAFTVILS
jgi:hypothetical protein